MTWSSLALAFVFALPSAAPSDCPACKPDAICGPHVQAEQKVLDVAKPKLRAKEVAERRSALQQIADLSRGHLNAPSRTAAEALAIGLRDDSFDVRADAARLLGKEQHPDAAVKALTGALDDIREEVAKLGKGDGARGGGAVSITSETGKAYVSAVCEGLAALPDDRGVDALADLLRQLEPGAADAVVVPIVHALATLDARDGIRAVVQRFVAAEGSRGKSKNGNSGGGRAGGAGGGAGGGGPGGGGGAGGRPGGGRAGNGDRDGDGFRDKVASDDQKHALHDALHGAALAKKLDDSPEYGDHVAQAWKDWFDKHQSAFRAKLGKVGGAPVAAGAPAGRQ